MGTGVVDGALIVDTRIDNGGAKRGAAEFKRLVDGMKNSINRAGQTMAAAGNGYLRSVRQQAQATRETGAEMRRLQERVVSLNREMDKMRRAGITDENRQRFQQLDSELRNVVSRMNELHRAQGETTQATVENTERQVEAVSGLRRAFETVGGAATSMLRTIGRFAGSAAISFLRNLASGAKNAAIQLLKLAEKTVVNGIRRLGAGVFSAARAMLGLHRSTRQSNTGMRMSLKNVLKYAFGIRSLFVLFNRLRSAIKEAFGEMEKSSPEVRDALKGLRSALAGLKGSLATAFEPILTAIAPALTTLINLLTQAINTIGAFFAALTGRGYYYAANGMNTIGDAASNASNDVKALKRQLAGFDELNILSEKNSGGSGGGGDGGTGTGISFTREEIGSGILDFTSKLRSMWENADFEGIGNLIAGKINAVFEKAREMISWDKLGEKITAVVTAITEIINSLVDGVDWTLVGQTFGEGINTLLHTVNLLLTGIDWAGIGASLADGLTSLVNTVDWSLLGDTIGQHFGAALKLIGTLIHNFDWATLGTKLAEGINSLSLALMEAVTSIRWDEIGIKLGTGLSNLITGINWGHIGVTLGDSFNGVLNVIYNAISNFDFKESASAIANGVNELIKTVDWKKLGETLSEAFKGAFDFLSTAIAEIDWRALGEDAKEALVAIDWNGVIDSVFTAIGAAFGGLGAFIGGLINDACKGIKDYFDTSIEAAGGDVVAGVFNGIVEAIKNVGQWIYEHVFKPLINGFKSAFGIASPAKNMEDTGGNIIGGVLQGIINGLKDIYKWVKDNIFKPIWSAIKKAGTTVVTITVSLVKKLGEWANDVWDFLVAGAETIVKTVQAVGKGIATFATSVWLWIRNGAEKIAKTVQAIGEGIATFATSVWLWIRNGAQEIVKTVQAVGEGIVSFATDAWIWIRQGTQNIVKTVKAVGEGIVSFATDAWIWIRNGAQEIVKTVKAIAGDVSSFVGKVWDFITGPSAVSKTIQAGAQVLKWFGDQVWNFIIGNAAIGKMINLGAQVLQWFNDAVWGFITGADTIVKWINIKLGFGETSDPYYQSGGQYTQEWYDSHIKAPIERISEKDPLVVTVQSDFDWSGWDAEWIKRSAEDRTVEILGKLGGKKNSLNLAEWLKNVTNKDNPSVSILGNLIKKGSNWDGSNGLLKWFKSATGTDGTVNVTANVTKGKNVKEGTIYEWLGAAGKVITITVNVIGAFIDWLKSFRSNGNGAPEITVPIGLRSEGWSTVTAWVQPFAQTAVTQKVGLDKYDWTWVDTWAKKYAQTPISQMVGLDKKGWNLVDTWAKQYAQTPISQMVGLEQKGWTWVDTWAKQYAQTPISQMVGLEQKGWTWVDTWAKKYAQTPISQMVGLDKKGWSTVTNWVANSITGPVEQSVVLKTQGSIAKAFTGGTITANGLQPFASGGAIRGGIASWWDHVQKYATGTGKPHGTVFVAGEAGPEVVGHVNGRTEILNKSQLAQAMYGAIVSGMGQAVNALGRYLAGHMTTCTNAVIRVLSAGSFGSIEYHAPAMATGAVLPYDISAQLAKSTADIQGTLDANNEDLIQTIISVAGQIVAAVRGIQPATVAPGGMDAQQMINEINRRTLMFGASPLQGV